LCGGGCCVRGGDTAYLTAGVLRRFMARHPALGPAEVLAAFLDRLADHTEAGSCINHSSKGCTLPRDMRSEACNNYGCDALKAVHPEASGAGRIEGVIAIRRRQDQWTRDKLMLDNKITALAVITVAGIVALPVRD
ncbi:MAG: hypothetical protein ABI696_05340, partial [Rubrivivax sp.]